MGARSKKPKKKSYPHTEKVETFEIKAPRWCLYVCLGTAAVSLLGILIFFALKSSMDKETFSFIYLFAFLLILGGVGVYACWYENFTLYDGVYTYYKPFLKNQSAHAKDIAYVKLITVCRWGTRGYSEDYRVIFYGHDGQILIKFYDDGTAFKNEIFLKSLRTHQIKTKRETKEINNI